MAVYTTEIASDKIASDNPIHQRLLKPYYSAKDYIKGDLLEIGCGEGRGVGILKNHCSSFTAIDKIDEVVEQLAAQYPEATFIHDTIPPLNKIADNSFDSLITFQVIEHIREDELFVEEIYRVLRPGGVALLTTPNINMTLTRNPWHVREYTCGQLEALLKSTFAQVEMKGIDGNEKVMEYYNRNKESVKRITRFDVFNLQYRLPAAILKIPYDILNRVNRNRLKSTDDELVKSITHDDYMVTDRPDTALDLFCIVRK